MNTLTGKLTVGNGETLPSPQLVDMIGYSIKKKCKRIIFARTALEIKSAVGAKPIQMVGFIKHHNPLINAFVARFFGYLEPETHWQERHPFK